jgi:agmatinase
MTSSDKTTCFLPDEACALDGARIVVVPVPYDGTSTWGKGADKGPRAIFAASKHLEAYDIETGTEVWRQGIATDAPVLKQESPEAMVGAVETRVGQHLAKGRFPVVVGGEHSVSIGAIRAYAKQYSDLTVLQLDAHSDLREQYCGSSYNHACVMARVQASCPIVQVGIRSMDISELKRIDPQRIFYARDICRADNDQWINGVKGQLTQHVYITLDLDVFDPSIMSSTGTPEPGGLLWYPVLSLLRQVCSHCDVVGFDVVELCPESGNRACDFLAAKLIYTLLTYCFHIRSKKNGACDP